MRTLLFAACLALAAGAGCSKDEPPASAEAKAEIPSVTIDQLEQMLAKGECQAVDANGDATRKKLGVIPGAVLLSDSETFSTKELPADKTKPLVFYCANTHCGASHDAAGKARMAGYQDVKVLPDGIAGWVKAGKQTEAPNRG